MGKIKNHLVLSVVSFLLVLTVLGSGTFAWFMDTEQTSANFQSGILDVELVVDHTDETVPLNFTNLRPLTIEQLRDEFQMDENGVITNKNEDGFAGNPLYFFQVNVENRGSLPMQVKLAVREQKKDEGSDLPYGDKIPNLVDNGHGGVKVDEDEPEIACQNDLREFLHVQLYQTELTDNGYVLTPVLEEADDAAAQKNDEVSDGTVTLWKNGKPFDYVVPEVLPAGGKTSYILAAWLPQTVGNECQGKHFHGALYVNAGQVDEGATMTAMPDWSEPESTVEATVKVRYELADGKPVKEVERVIQEKPGEVVLKPLASELEGTGFRLTDADETYTVSLSPEGKVTYQANDTAATFTVEDTYVDDPSKEFDDGDGTQQNPYIIMNARQLDNVRNHLDAHYKLGRDIDLTGYYGATWVEQGWTEEMGWMPIGWPSSTSQQVFKGSLDGQSHTIIGLKINSEEDYMGLFARIFAENGKSDSGVVCNLNIETPEVCGCTSSGKSVYGRTGVIVGQTNNGALIDRCTIKGGFVKGGKEDSPTKAVGGIVGFVGTSTKGITNCTVDDLDVAVTSVDEDVAVNLIAGYVPSKKWDILCRGSSGSGHVNGIEVSVSFK
ncbi:MAG: TasA family protein [Anaeromassilibacillus sp.]